MSNTGKASTQLVIVAVAAAGALVGGGTSAHADPPPGWGPGQYGVEYDLADMAWAHHGWYQGVRGNWHTGYVNVEEDDDGLTVELNDWWCPRGVKPPRPYDDPTASRCMSKSGKSINDAIQADISDFDQARNRLTVHGDFTDYFGSDTVRVDLTIQGRGKPEVTSDESGPILDYSEIFQATHASGRVDGRRVSGPRTRQDDVTRVGFWLDGWERTP